MTDDPAIPPGSRRSFLARSAGIAAGAAALSILPRPSLRAAPQAMQELIRKVVGEAPLDRQSTAGRTAARRERQRRFADSFS